LLLPLLQLMPLMPLVLPVVLLVARCVLLVRHGRKGEGAKESDLLPQPGLASDTVTAGSRDGEGRGGARGRKGRTGLPYPALCRRISEGGQGWGVGRGRALEPCNRALRGDETWVLRGKGEQVTAVAGGLPHWFPHMLADSQTSLELREPSSLRLSPSSGAIPPPPVQAGSPGRS